jgi:nicotinamide-nucleotide amidase
VSAAGAHPDAVAIVAELTRRGWSVAVAESLTGGLLASALVDVPGASAAVRGGVVAYDTRVKAQTVGVDADLLRRTGPVDPEVARQLADRVRHALAVDGASADVGVATTGVAGPDPQRGHPVGEVWIGIALPGAAPEAIAIEATGDRRAIREAAVAAALAALRARL